MSYVNHLLWISKTCLQTLETLQVPGTLERKFCLLSDFPSGKQGLPLHFIGFLPKGRGVQTLGVKTIGVYKSA